MLVIPEWVYEFHGHRCPFMPIGYRMGVIGLRELGVERATDHGMYVFPEIGIGHPQTCMADGLQASTGCTYGKMMIERRNFGKIAATIYHQDHGAIRIAATASFLNDLGKFEFFSYRQKGIEPSQIPLSVTQETIDFVVNSPEETAFTMARVDGFTFARPKNSFAKTICSACGEVVFDRYVRMKDGKPVCIPCSGYASHEDGTPQRLS
jgi:formylmethanofuran dehydrogenase subunit E